mmetsp:Transcript_43748/g.113589  ORF Transcript_43748/g.113589 Transcript_43748/m.113589 type:complete len:238 (+) Transcript_43748:82-795(+)
MLPVVKAVDPTTARCTGTNSEAPHGALQLCNSLLHASRHRARGLANSCTFVPKSRQGLDPIRSLLLQRHSPTWPLRQVVCARAEFLLEGAAACGVDTLEELAGLSLACFAVVLRGDLHSSPAQVPLVAGLINAGLRVGICLVCFSDTVRTVPHVGRCEPLCLRATIGPDHGGLGEGLARVLHRRSTGQSALDWLWGELLERVAVPQEAGKEALATAEQSEIAHRIPVSHDCGLDPCL